MGSKIGWVYIKKQLGKRTYLIPVGGKEHRGGDGPGSRAAAGGGRAQQHAGDGAAGAPGRGSRAPGAALPHPAAQGRRPPPAAAPPPLRTLAALDQVRGARAPGARARRQGARALLLEQLVL